MKKIIMAILMITCILSAGCANSQYVQAPTAAKASVVKITAAEAKARLDLEVDKIIIVDVRTPAEYNEAHIEKAILLPVDTIGKNASSVIPDREAVYFVYCRTGNRSAAAAGQLMQMGYRNIYDLGGIRDWPYGTVSGTNTN
jgi:rhodanese-related sulfurtransferase